MSQELIISLLMDFIMLLFLTIAFFISLDILKNWDYDKVSLKQAKLQKRVYLSSSILAYVVSFRIVLFFVFLHTLDKLADIITGAMCTVGVLSNTQVGIYVLIIKAIVILFCALWLLLFSINQKDKFLSYTKKLYGFYIFLYIFVLIEFILLVVMAMSIDTDKIVSCCSTLFSITQEGSGQSLFKISSKYLIPTYIFIYLLSFYKNKFSSAIIAILFFVVSILAITSFFSPYIYELPNHRCPFCILQRDYYYIGYVIYIFLGLSLYYGVANIFLYLFVKKEFHRYYKYFIVSNTLIIAILFFYVLRYYFLNGVFL